MNTASEQLLLSNIKERMPALESLLQRARSHSEYEDHIYRYYHGSFKVFAVQSITNQIVAALRELLPGVELNRQFVAIIDEGTGKQFRNDTNAYWDAATRPLLEAFFHARFMLEMVIEYGCRLEAPPETLPSGWAAVLYLYNIR